jgi:hypothetical protein
MRVSSGLGHRNRGPTMEKIVLLCVLMATILAATKIVPLVARRS